MPSSRRVRPEDELSAPETESHAAPVARSELLAAPGQVQQGGLSRDLVLQLQRTRGNAYVNRLVSSGSTLQRYKKPPTAAESVGGERGKSEKMDPLPGEKGAIDLGEQGYTLQMLKKVPKAAGKTFALYEEDLLEPVKVTFNKLDTVTIPGLAEEIRKADDEADSWANTPSTTKTYKDSSARNQGRMEQFVKDRGREQQIAQDYNAGVPRANQTIVSLAKLEAMQNMLGVNSPQALTSAVVKSLKEAQEIAARSQGGPKGVSGISPPKAAEQVTQASMELTQAQKELSTSWLGVQQNLVLDHAAELKQKGETDEKRLAEINENIATARKIGATIDVSMTVISGGATMVEGGGGKTLKPSEMTDMLAAEKPDLSDKSSMEGAKKVGGAISKSMGIEIPTSASGLLEGAAKIYYSSELEGIRKRLVELQIQVGAFGAAAEKIGLAKRVKEFEDALTRFELKSGNLQRAMLDRQMAYLQLGQQIDAASRTDPTAKAAGQATGSGQERFATVMAVTSAVREVLAMAAGAQKGFGRDAKSVGNELLGIAQNRAGYGWPDEEDKPFGWMYYQQKNFEAFTDNISTALKPIDEKAGEMMTALSLGNEKAAEY